MKSDVHPDDAALHPAKRGFPAGVADVRELATDASSARLNSGCANLGLLSRLQRLSRVWFFGASGDDVELLANCRSLTDLHLDMVRTDEFRTLGRLPGLRTLTVSGATRMRTLEQFAQFVTLERFGIENSPRVESLDPLAALTELRALDVSGSMWTAIKVRSLAPIARLQRLRFLMLTGLRCADGSLEPLAGLSALEVLECARAFPWQEFARLATKLPSTRCRWFSATSPTSLPCDVCGATRVMLSGSGQPTLCPACDEARVARHAARFTAIAGPSAR